MPKQTRTFEGKTYTFPDDATEAEMMSAVDADQMYMANQRAAEPTVPPRQPSSIRRGFDVLTEGGLNLKTGIRKGVAGTALNIGEMTGATRGLERLVGMPPNYLTNEARVAAQPTGTMQQIGKGVEQIAEFTAPSAALGSLSRVPGYMRRVPGLTTRVGSVIDKFAKTRVKDIPIHPRLRAFGNRLSQPPIGKTPVPSGTGDIAAAMGSTVGKAAPHPTGNLHVPAGTSQVFARVGQVAGKIDSTAEQAARGADFLNKIRNIKLSPLIAQAASAAGVAGVQSRGDQNAMALAAGTTGVAPVAGRLFRPLAHAVRRAAFEPIAKKASIASGKAASGPILQAPPSPLEFEMRRLQRVADKLGLRGSSRDIPTMEKYRDAMIAMSDLVKASRASLLPPRVLDYSKRTAARSARVNEIHSALARRPAAATLDPLSIVLGGGGFLTGHPGIGAAAALTKQLARTYPGQTAHLLNRGAQAFQHRAAPGTAAGLQDELLDLLMERKKQ